MGWQRLGHVFGPDGSKPWARSHAALPTPLHLHGEVFRFYFSSRDADRRSHIGWVDVEVSEMPRVIAMADRPVLSPGEDGSFDDSGVSIGCIVPVDGRLRLYYLGWNLGLRGSWRNAIGVAEADTADGPFVRYSPGPILDRSPQDPYTLSYPFVTVGSDGWRMWYGSSLSPARGNTAMNYGLKHALSQDGLNWCRDGCVVVAPSTSNEFAIARASIVTFGETQLMMLSHRGDTYRIGAATSGNGIDWTRIDSTMGLAPTPGAWDSETCYANVFYHRDRLWMAYNGNGYGATGFGLAVWTGELNLDARSS